LAWLNEQQKKLFLIVDELDELYRKSPSLALENTLDELQGLGNKTTGTIAVVLCGSSLMLPALISRTTTDMMMKEFPMLKHAPDLNIHKYSTSIACVVRRCFCYFPQCKRSCLSGRDVLCRWQRERASEIPKFPRSGAHLPFSALRFSFFFCFSPSAFRKHAPASRCRRRAWLCIDEMRGVWLGVDNERSQQYHRHFEAVLVPHLEKIGPKKCKVHQDLPKGQRKSRDSGGETTVGEDISVCERQGNFQMLVHQRR